MSHWNASSVLKNNLIGAIILETGKNDPNWKSIETLRFAAAKEELRLAIAGLEEMDTDATANIMSALSLIKDVTERRKAVRSAEIEAMGDF